MGFTFIPKIHALRKEMRWEEVKRGAHSGQFSNDYVWQLTKGSFNPMMLWRQKNVVDLRQNRLDELHNRNSILQEENEPSRETLQQVEALSRANKLI